MHNIIVSNATGNEIELLHNDNFYKLVNIDGMSPVPSSLKSLDVETIPGELFTTSKDSKRTLTFQFYLDSNAIDGINMLCSVFQKNQAIEIKIDDYFIEARVETIDTNPFSDKVECQIVVQCFYPYFKSIERRIINTDSNISNRLEFPVEFTMGGISLGELENGNTLSIYNESNISSGCKIDLYVYSYLKHVNILNATNNSRLEIEIDNNDDIINHGYVIHADLESTRKDITARNTLNEPYPIINYVNLEKELFYLSPGQNMINIITDAITENVNVTFSYNPLKDWVM